MTGSPHGDPLHIFVYGTLRADAGSPAHEMLRALAAPVGDAVVTGRLYDLGAYPGVVIDAGHAHVRGEVYALLEPRVLEQLDAYEGCGPRDPRPHQFVRRTCTAHLRSGGAVPCWVYHYAGPLDDATPIEGGDYASFRRPRR